MSSNGHDTQAELSTDLRHGTDNVQASGVGLGIKRMREEDQKLVPSAVEMSDFSLWRSLRRGAVLETTTHKVDVQVIELINRWRKKEAARGSEAGLPMRQVYTQVGSLRGSKTDAPAVGPRSLSNSDWPGPHFHP